MMAIKRQAVFQRRRNFVATMHSNALFRCATLVLLMLFMVGCGGTQSPTQAPDATSTATSTNNPMASPMPEATVPVASATPIGSPPAASAAPLQAGWWDSAVCYEVFVRSFYDSNGDGIGDLNGLIEKLDYINDGDAATDTDLGATCIWLMPITEGASYHAYDVVDYYNVERDYGTNEDFKRLIDEAHQRGVHVILDLVLNHTSSEHPWFKDAIENEQSPYRDWYIWSSTDPGDAWHPSQSANEFYYGVFWSGMPDLNYRNPAVTEEVRKISTFWLDEMDADGFRLDAIKHLIEDGTVQENTPETHAWLRDYAAFLRETKEDVFTIGEIFGATPVVLNQYYPDQLDTYFVFDVGIKTLTAAATGQAKQMTGAVRVADNSLPFQRYAPFLTNHDQDRVMSVLGNDVAKAKLAATALLTMPGLPFVYYGEEIGMLGKKPDERIRTPMQWTGDANGGFTSGQPWQALQDNLDQSNVEAQDGDPESLLNLYRRLIKLHTQQPALAQGQLSLLDSPERTVAAFLRHTGDEAVLVVINFGREAVQNVPLSLEESDLPAGSYQLDPLLGDQAGADLTIDVGGAINAYVPLPTLSAQTGYIFKLEQ